jgi:Tol biopolymer transport system component
LNDSLVFAEKSGIDQISEFVVIDREGNEKRIHRPGFYNPANISVGKGKVVWTEIIPDVRWARSNFSIIKVFDINSGTEKMLTSKSRYFAPDLSPDGTKVVVVETDLQNQYFLVVLAERNGEVLHRIPSPENSYLQFPVWSGDQKGIYMTTLGTGGKRIV